MRVGVVIPVYKQAQFLIECFTSIVSQTLMPTGVAIVNDGCPNPSSDTLPRAIAAAWPEQALYLRQDNRGLSSARNTGIRALLKRWPQIEAILPLDADDWLDAPALEAMAARLAANDRPDWAYPDIRYFGAEFRDWKPAPQLNRFRFCFENSCCASSLIRREVFDAGVFYDETMRDGYEDWEFFFRALDRGFRGASAGDVGFNYRIKKNSMVIQAAQKRKQIMNQTHQRHHLVPKTLTGYEHKYMPRFRFIDEHRQDYCFSDPMAATAWNPLTGQGYAPPITILGSGAAFELLKRSGTLRGILFLVQHQLRTHALRIDLEHQENGLGFERKHGVGGIPALFAIQSEWLENGTISANNIRSVVSSAPSLVVSSPQHGELLKSFDAPDFELQCRHASLPVTGEVETMQVPLERGQCSNTRFARAHHFDFGETTYPLTSSNEIDTCFAVSQLRWREVDRCVLKLAEAVKRTTKSVRLHLVLTESGAIDFDAEQLSVFDEIVSVAHCDREEQVQMLSSILSSMDIVINAHSLRAYRALPLLPKRPQAVHRPVCVSYLHFIEVTADETLFGYPSVACEYEAEIDCFLVASEQLRDFLINSGINEERIRIGRSAPVIRPASRKKALVLADRKAARQRSGAGRLELLFPGWLDQEKLSRLTALVRLANREGINLWFTIIESTTFRGMSIDWPADRVRLVEAITDPAILARHFETADGFVLLSPCEGVPVALLDAMAHGCIVLASDIGPVAELIVDGVNGFLCPSSASDDVIARAALDRIKFVLSDLSGCREVRRRAAETAMGLSWTHVAGTLDEFLIHTPLTSAI